MKNFVSTFRTNIVAVSHMVPLYNYVFLETKQSSKRYKSVAKITSRRARKGFNLKFNPDEHWSEAFYKGLNKLQYTDGMDIVIINRDDTAGFRLDTLTTCKQYTTPVVQGSEVLSTRTDYVNKYP